MKFTKKPVTIEAFQMTKERRMDNAEWPEWLNKAWNKDAGQIGSVCRQNPDAPMPDLLCISTMEGVHRVQWGDWIIRGVNGELYPCKPDIFEKTYVAGDIDTIRGTLYQDLRCLGYTTSGQTSEVLDAVFNKLGLPT